MSLLEEFKVYKLWNLTTGTSFMSTDPTDGRTYTIGRFENKMVEVKDDSGKNWVWPNSASVLLVERTESYQKTTEEH